jgi:zinc transport system substrate-binding protein
MYVLRTYNKKGLITGLGKMAFAIFLTISVITGCHQETGKGKKQLITVSILPQKYFVEKIAGEIYNINVLIPSGASPETYEPTPSQIIKLEKSAIYFEIGYIEMEINRMNDFLLNKPDLKAVNCSDGISLIKMEDKWVEPHIWLSPKNVKVIAKNIYNGLVEIDPDNQMLYRENLDKFLQEIDEINNKITSRLKNLESRSFLIYHPALTYFAKDYGLNQVPVQIEGKAPSSKYMKTIIEKAKKKDIKVIVVQQQFDIQKANTIAKEIDGKAITINPLNYNWEEEMMNIATELKNALQNNL